MKLNALIVSRPLCLSIVLGILVLIAPSCLIPSWYSTMKSIHRHVRLNSITSQNEIHSDVKKMAKFLDPLRSSATNLVSILTTLNLSEFSFSQIQNKVAPLLFEGISIIPYASQISYIGSEGLSFSYYIDQSSNQTLALYSNSTFMNSTYWYTQQVSLDTGNLYGNVTLSEPLVTYNTSWFVAALNATNGSYSSLQTRLSNAHDQQELVFLTTSRIDGARGVISLGFPVKELVAVFTSFISEGGFLYLSAKEGDHQVFVDDQGLTTVDGYGLGQIGNVSCKFEDGLEDSNQILNIKGIDYAKCCSPLEVLGVKSVYVLGLPQNGLATLVHKNTQVALILLILMVITAVISVSLFVFTIARAAKREMHLCGKLIRQMEATQQAERKSMNKSLAFASASHDIRASLAGLTGLIDLCSREVAPASEMGTNLRLMDDCTKDLVGLLSSVLDMSKIESGKMQLEEEEFDLSLLLEDVVDLYHPVGNKKGIDVILDPHDGSAIKFSQVRGDRGKLKQILCNLLSNAVKFTSEGNVSVRCWVRKPSFQDKIIASNCKSGGVMKHLSFLFCNKNKEAYEEDLEAMRRVHEQNPNMEFVFEVDDTGKGIPKEKHMSVFENYVQVKETALGHQGTGLGLGIVQSLVRLMRGDITIIDKEFGERGTCFRFNVLLDVYETISNDNNNVQEAQDIESAPGQLSPKLTIHAPSPDLNLQSYSPRLTTRTQSPKLESSRAVLLIHDNQRRLICKNFMKSLGIKVTAVERLDQLPLAFKQILDKHNQSRHSSRSNSPRSFLSKSTSGESNNFGAKEVPFSSIDGTNNYILSVFKKGSIRGISGFVLIVIDLVSGPFEELWRIVADFKGGLHNALCRVVWLENPLSKTMNIKMMEEVGGFDPNDVIISRPFHGTRLYEVVRLLPEFGGSLSRLQKMERSENNSSAYGSQIRRGGAQRSRSSSSEPTTKAQIQSPSGSKSRTSANQNRGKEIQEESGVDWNKQQPLRGKKILVVEDTAVLRKLSASLLQRLGATVEVCNNGQEALELVSNGLENQREHGSSNVLPHDYILMDCQMPIMDGLEATRQIRSVERYYGTHVPIIALTADSSGEERRKTFEAGMDDHLVKPMQQEDLLGSIAKIDKNLRFL